MKTIFLASLIILTTLSVGCTPKGKALAKVGGDVIYEADIDKIIRTNPRLRSGNITPDIRKKILAKYIDQVVLYQESLRRGLHRSDLVKEKLDLFKDMIIAQAAVEDEVDVKAKEYYENHADEFEPIEFAHILVKFKNAKDKKTTRSEEAALTIAQGLKSRLNKGEAFDALAKTSSEDLKTKDQGGNLGKITLNDRKLRRSGWGNLIEKSMAMKKGDVSEPIKSENGYHLITVVEEKTLQPLEEVIDGLRFRMQGPTRLSFVAELKRKAKIKIISDEPEATEPTSDAPEVKVKIKDKEEKK